MKGKENEYKETGAPSHAEDFKGYSLAELRYQRALLVIKKEFEKEKAIKEIKKIKSRIPVINGKSPMDGISTMGVVGKIIRGLSFADYLMLGFQALRIGKKAAGLLKRK